MTVPSLLHKPVRRMVTRNTAAAPMQPLPKRAVTDRLLLGEGFIVSMKQPSKTNKMCVPNTGESYEQFGVPVKGGYLNFHLYAGNECQRRGKRFWAIAQIFAKTMEDSTKFIYVDLRPTNAAHLSHELKVYQDKSLMPSELCEGSVRFDCPGDIHGVLAFIPIAMNEATAD